MDSVSAEPIIRRLLASIVDSIPPWPNGTPDLGPPPRGNPTMLHAPRGKIIVNSEGLSSNMRAAWTSRFEFMTQKAWDARDVREAGVFYTITPLQRWGRFVRVELNASERNARTANESPAVNASGVTYVLMSVEGGWVIVEISAWVT